jgi:hypothetical protein
VSGVRTFTHMKRSQAPRRAPTSKPKKQQVQAVINFEDDDDSDGADVEEESDVDEVRDDAAPENPAPLPVPPVVLPLPVPVAAPGPRAVAAQVVQDLFKAGTCRSIGP